MAGGGSGGGGGGEGDTGKGGRKRASDIEGFYSRTATNDGLFGMYPKYV